MGRPPIGLLLTLALGGCAATAPLIDRDGPAVRQSAAAARIRIVLAGERVPRHAQRMVPAEAYACRQAGTDAGPAQEDALRQLRDKAERIGGNALLDVTFETRGIETLGSDCSQTVTASGTVARLRR